ncbi:3564_t:CDS:1, partial [Rhizophagus irregularis]
MKKVLTCFVMGKSLVEFMIVVAEEISIDNGWIPIKEFNVGLLKKHIWKEISNDFDGSGIVLNRLNLWKAEIPISEENRKVLENPEIEYIKQTFNLKKLDPSDIFLE